MLLSPKAVRELRNLGIPGTLKLRILGTQIELCQPILLVVFDTFSGGALKEIGNVHLQTLTAVAAALSYTSTRANCR